MVNIMEVNWLQRGGCGDCYDFSPCNKSIPFMEASTCDYLLHNHLTLLGHRMVSFDNGGEIGKILNLR